MKVTFKVYVGIAKTRTDGLCTKRPACFFPWLQQLTNY